MNCSRKQIFRNEIRRKQIDDMFAHERKICLEKAINKQHEDLGAILETQQQRSVWVMEMMKKFQGHPNSQWLNDLRELSMSVRYFENFFDLWMKSGLMNTLIMLLKRGIDDELTEFSAIILGEVFYYLPDESDLIDQILEFEFILELVQLCSPFVKNAQEYYRLVIEMISHRYYIRDKFIDNGIVQNLVNRLKQRLQFQTDETFMAFGLIFRLLRIYEKQKYKLYPKRNVCSTFVPVLEIYLVETSRKDTIEVILKCILQLVELNNLPIFSLIAHSPNILKLVLHYLCLESQPLIRMISAGVLVNYLCSPNVNHAKQLNYLGFLDKINECIRIQKKNSCFQSETKNMNMSIKILLALQNFAANSNEQCQALFEHPVFEYIIEKSHQSQSLKVKYEAMYNFGTIIATQQFNLIDKLVSDYKVLQIFVLNLNTPSQDFICQILDNLIALVAFYDNIFTGKVNKVIDILERFYNIDIVLKQIEDSCSNKKVHRKIDLLVAKLNGQ